MTTFSESNSPLSSPFGRTLVVQSGIEKTNTIDLMRDVDSISIEIADDIYEAITRVGLAEENTPVRTVCIPLMIPDYSPDRVVQAFRRMSGKIKLILIVPSGRSEACSAALKAGFDNVLEIPTSSNSIADVLNGNTSSKESAAHELAPPAIHPVETPSQTPTTDANRACLLYTSDAADE